MKKIFIILLLILVFFVVFKYGISPSNKPIKSTDIKQANSISVGQQVNIYDSVVPRSYGVEEGTTALDLLKETTKVTTKGEGENAFVVEINGRKADETKKEFWAFYINGKMSAVGAGSYKLKNNDKIEWKIENY